MRGSSKVTYRPVQIALWGLRVYHPRWARSDGWACL